MTHVKAAIYDGWACLGSANFDKMSLRVGQELDVAFSDPATVERLKKELFETDFERSRELTKPVRSTGSIPSSRPSPTSCERSGRRAAASGWRCRAAQEFRAEPQFCPTGNGRPGSPLPAAARTKPVIFTSSVGRRCRLARRRLQGRAATLPRRKAKILVLRPSRKGRVVTGEAIAASDAKM